MPNQSACILDWEEGTGSKWSTAYLACVTRCSQLLGRSSLSWAALRSLKCKQVLTASVDGSGSERDDTRQSDASGHSRRLKKGFQ